MLTSQGQAQGTPAFMPPEVALGTQPIDGRADLYSLGCAAYWVLTGQPPFEAESLAQMILHHIRSRPVPPSERSEVPIPPALDAILLRCLEKDPADRWSSAGRLDSELAAVPCDPPWTPARARDWWTAHAPESLGLSTS